MPVTPTPEVIKRMIDATNAADTEAFIACFSERAYLDDWGREFHGKEGVRSWDESDNIGQHMHFDVTSVRKDGSAWIVSVHATSDGFSGQGSLHVTLDGDHISRLILAG